MSQFLFAQNKLSTLWEETNDVQTQVDNLDSIIVQFNSENFFQNNTAVRILENFQVDWHNSGPYRVPEIVFEGLSDDMIPMIKLTPVIYSAPYYQGVLYNLENFTQLHHLFYSPFFVDTPFVRYNGKNEYWVKEVSRIICRMIIYFKLYYSSQSNYFSVFMNLYLSLNLTRRNFYNV